MIEVSNYTPDYKIYLSLEDLEEETLRPMKREAVINLLGGLTYSQLVEVEDFIRSNYKA